MKRLFIILAVLLWPITASASSQLIMLAGTQGAAAAPSYVLQETWDGGSNSYDDSTVLDNTGWSHTSTAAINNAYSTCPDGSAGCMAIVSSDGGHSATGTDGDHYFSFLLSGATGTCSTSINRTFDLLNGTAKVAIVQITRTAGCDIDTIGLIDYSDAEVLRLLTNYTTDITTPNTNAKYWKVLYNNGTGSNAVFKVWISADGSSWTEVINVTAGTNTLQVNAIRFREQRANQQVFDDYRESTTDINY